MRSTAAVLTLLAFATPALAQDPVKVDPGHHKVEIDNPHVRVLRITLGPGEKTPSHDHPAGMAIYMTDVQARISPVGAAVNETPRKAGEVVAVPGGKHTVENIGKTSFEVVLVEFKHPPSKGWTAGARDAVKVDPKHYSVAAENDHGRALRVRYGPNEKSVMHDHPATVAAFFSTGKAMMTSPDGTTAEMATEKGAVQFSDAQTHLPASSADGVEVIVVELKTAAAPKP
jgi:quercetin dioxygenase-like cupin family protein